MEPDAEITQLLRQWQQGDREAERALFDALYRNLHDIAIGCLRSEQDAGSLGPTALVNEAYLRFANAGALSLADRNHFLALTARVMRRIIVDRARARKSRKRGGRELKAQFHDELAGTAEDPDVILAVDVALRKLDEEFPRPAKIVELHFFGGLSMEETAAILGVSSRTARRDWQWARLRLKVAIDGAANV
jgi:RNA polymerase sigma factor (TIGR02999 family)